MQPGQGRVADGRAVVNRRPVQRLPQDLLGAQPDLRRVPVPGQVHQAGHVPAVAVPAQEQPGLLALAQAQHAQRDRDELLGRDLEQLLPRVVLEDLGQILAVVAAGGQPGLGQHVGHLAPDHRDAGDGRGVRRVRIQAEEPELSGDRSVRAELLDRDIVQVVGAVDGGPGVGLGQHQPLGRVLRPGRHLCGQLAQRVPAAPGVAEDAQAGARHGAQGGGAVGRLHQVVLAVAEEGEVAVGQPAQQVAGLGRRRCPGARRDRPASRRAAASIRAWSSAATRTSSRTRRRSVSSCCAVTRSPGGSSSTWIQDSVSSSGAAGAHLVAAQADDLRAAPVTSRRTRSSGCTSMRISAWWRFSRVVTESTRYGMSSVTMSTTRLGARALVQVRSPASRTWTRARPCGRCRPSRAWASATTASREGEARSSVATR